MEVNEALKALRTRLGRCYTATAGVPVARGSVIDNLERHIGALHTYQDIGREINEDRVAARKAGYNDLPDVDYSGEFPDPRYWRATWGLVSDEGRQVYAAAARAVSYAAGLD